MAWAGGLVGKMGAGAAAKGAGGLIGAGPSGLMSGGKALGGKAAGAGKGLLDEGMMGAMMQRGASGGGGGKQAYQEGLTGGMSALSQYHDMSNVGEKSMLDPQIVFGMMNNMQYKPGQRKDVHAQWSMNPRRQQSRGLI